MSGINLASRPHCQNWAIVAGILKPGRAIPGERDQSSRSESEG